MVSFVHCLPISAVQDGGFETFCLLQSILSTSMTNTVYVFNYLKIRLLYLQTFMIFTLNI